jgi:hypothetical protein
LRGLENLAVLRFRQYPYESFTLVLDYSREQPCLLAWFIEAVGGYQRVAFLIHQREKPSSPFDLVVDPLDGRR